MPLKELAERRNILHRKSDAQTVLRHDADETFLQAYRRLGLAPFKALLYPSEEKANAA